MHIIVNPFFYFFPLCLRKWVSPAFYLRRRAKKRGAGIFLMVAAKIFRARLRPGNTGLQIWKTSRILGLSMRNKTIML